MRHSLSDAAETDDAERHVAGAMKLARGKVMPLPGMNVAVISDDVAHQRERERQRMGRHLADAVVGRIGEPDAVPRAGVGIDRVVAGADAAHDAKLRQCSKDALGDRRVLEQDARAIAGGRDHVVLGLALRDGELDAGGGEELALDLEVVKFVVGEQDAGHDGGKLRNGGWSAAQRYVRRRNWSSGLTDCGSWLAMRPL